MSKLTTVLEKWEHHFSGPDYHEDSPPDLETQRMTAHPKVTEVSTQLAAHYMNHDMPEEHKESLQQYARSSYRINRALIRLSKGEDHGLAPEKFAHVANVGKAIKHFGEHTPHDMHVYTGAGFDPSKHFEHGETHAKLHLPAYTSTTIQPGVADSFSTEQNDGNHHILKIHVPKGSHGAYIPGALHGTGEIDHDEHEFILHRNAKLHVHPEPTVESKGHRGRMIWHAKLVHDGVKDTRHMNE